MAGVIDSLIRLVVAFTIITIVVLIVFFLIIRPIIFPMEYNDVHEPDENKKATGTGLPESCNGVYSTDIKLNPNAELCVAFLYFKVYAECRNDNSLSQEEINSCRYEIDYEIDKECSAESDMRGIRYDKCVMSKLKSLYLQ